MLWFFYLSDPFSFSLCAPTQKRRAAFRSPPGDRMFADQLFQLWENQSSLLRPLAAVTPNRVIVPATSAPTNRTGSMPPLACSISFMFSSIMLSFISVFIFLFLLPDRRHFLFSVPGVLPWTLIDTEQLTGWQRFLKEIYDNMNLLRWTQLFQASAGSDAQISPGCIVRAKAVVSRYHPETSSDQMAR